MATDGQSPALAMRPMPPVYEDADESAAGVGTPQPYDGEAMIVPPSMNAPPEIPVAVSSAAPQAEEKQDNEKASWFCIACCRQKPADAAAKDLVLQATKQTELITQRHSVEVGKDLITVDGLEMTLYFVVNRRAWPSPCYALPSEARMRLLRDGQGKASGLFDPFLQQSADQEAVNALEQRLLAAFQEVQDRVRSDSENLESQLPIKRPRKVMKLLNSHDLLAFGPMPVKQIKERPWRYFPMPAPSYAQYLRQLPIVVTEHDASSEGPYCLEIWFRSLQFLWHPLMKAEELLAAQLLEAFTAYKQRQSLDLIHFYSDKLMGLEDALLSSRHQLLLTTHDAELMDSQRMSPADENVNDFRRRTLEEERRALYNKVLGLESAVFEQRLLLEEEEQKLYVDAIKELSHVYTKICTLREQQGYRLTPWELDIEPTSRNSDPSRTEGMSRFDMDVFLLMAEHVAVRGLDDAYATGHAAHYLPHVPDLVDSNEPYPGYAHPSPAMPYRQPGGQVRTPRRVECLVHAHQHAWERLQEQLARYTALQDQDVQAHAATVQRLEHELARLGSTPAWLAPNNDDAWYRMQEDACARVDSCEQRGVDIGVVRRPQPYTATLRNVGVESKSLTTAAQHQPEAPVKATIEEVYCALFVNGQYVSQTPAKLIRDMSGPGHTFQAHVVLEERAQVLLQSWPAKVTVRIFQVSRPPRRLAMPRRHLLAEVSLVVPGVADPAEFADLAPRSYQWVTPANAPLPESPWAEVEQRQLSSLNGPRDGANAESEPARQWSPVRAIVPSGVLYLQCAWVEPARLPGQEDGLLMVNNPAYQSHETVIDLPLKPPCPADMHNRLPQEPPSRRMRFAQWLRHAQLDPRDPDSADLLELQKLLEMDDLARPMHGIYRVNQRDESYMKPPTRSKKERWRRCRLRWRGVGDDLEGARGRGGARDASLLAAIRLVDEGRDLMLALTIRLHKLHDWLLELKGTFAQMKSKPRNRDVADFVHEIPLPAMDSSLFQTMLTALMPERKLAPKAVVQAPDISHSDETIVTITIRAANNLPRPVSGPQEQADTGLEDFQRREVGRFGARNTLQFGGAGGVTLGRSARRNAFGAAKPPSRWTFVEVYANGTRTRTSAAYSTAGDGPMWHEDVEIQIPVKATSLESPWTGHADDITILVFDEVVAGSVELDPQHATQRRLLATATLSQSTVLHAQQFRGLVTLTPLPCLVGYTPRDHLVPTLTMAATVDVQAATQIQPVPEPRYLSTTESSEFLMQEAVWRKRCTAAMPAIRQPLVRGMACSVDGTGYCLTRFIGPTPVPPTVTDYIKAVAGKNPPNVAEEKRLLEYCVLARFVSMVPNLREPPGEALLWATNAQVIQNSGGAAKEHAHLLAGLMVEMNTGGGTSGGVYVVVGTGFPGAMTFLVLTSTYEADQSDPLLGAAGMGERSDALERCRLWNPLNGTCTPLSNSGSELIDVSMVYSASNIWANVQEAGPPSDLKWDLSDPKSWVPLWSNTQPGNDEPAAGRAALPSIQTDPAYPSVLMYEHEDQSMLYDRDTAERLGLKLAESVERTVREYITHLRLEANLGTHTTPSVLVRDTIKTKMLPTVTKDSLIQMFRDVRGLRDGAGGQVAVQRLQERHLELLRSRVQSSAGGYKGIVGYLLCLPYSETLLQARPDELSAVQVAVQNTGIALTRGKEGSADDVRFAVAAHTEHLGLPFVCNVWLYLVATYHQ